MRGSRRARELQRFALMGAPVAFIKRHAWSLSLTAFAGLAFAYLASEVRAARVGQFDATLAKSIVHYRGRWDAPMLGLTKAGNLSTMTALCTLVVLTLFKVRKGRDASFLATCGLVALLLDTTLKAIFQRVRPDMVELYVLSRPGSFSFPSGHALGSMSVTGALVVLVFVRRAGLLWRGLALTTGALFVLGVGISRVYFGVHFPSDVLGGQLAGAALVTAMTGWFYPRLIPGEAAITSPPTPAAP